MNAEQPRYKHPRTPHIYGSPGGTADDVRSDVADLADLSGDEGIVVTLKMDGENMTVYSDGYLHARSVDYSPHQSRDWAKANLPYIASNLSSGWRICGENMYAVHSIEYTDLEGYFLVHSIWSPENECLSWDDTVLLAGLLGLPTVPVLYRGPVVHVSQIEELFAPYAQTHEGWVLRSAGAFRYSDFGKNVVKWVRKNHVQTDEHWMAGPIKTNTVREDLG